MGVGGQNAEGSKGVRLDEPKQSGPVLAFVPSDGDTLRSFSFFLIKSIGLTLVNKLIQVSRAHFYDASSAYCVVCASPQVKSSVTLHLTPFILFYLCPGPLPLLLTPKLLSMSMSVGSLVYPVPVLLSV